MSLADPEVQTVESPLIRYYPKLREISHFLHANSVSPSFRPSFELPSLGSRHRAYLENPDLHVRPLGRLRGRDVRLLDLTGNPETRTTKSFASLLMVLRAVDHIARTGERMTIVTPSSANKAVALRDAVLRAYRTGLADPERLRLVSVVPRSSAHKVWSSELDTDADLRAVNPVVFFDTAIPADVKAVALGAVKHALARPSALSTGHRIWFSLDLDNYRLADTARAFAEQEAWPHEGGAGRRLQAHAVSSAYGLLGHSFGERWSGPAVSSYLLIQHMAAPDMVLHWATNGDFSTESLPGYRPSSHEGLLAQSENAHFPYLVSAVDEVIDPTFYTRTPVTSGEMTAIIRAQGGGGIVVSRHECIQRYAEAHKLLVSGGHPGLPENHTDLREWSLLMGITGILNALERDLVPQQQILLHGSGTYASTDFSAVPESHAYVTADASVVEQVLLDTLAH